MQQVTESAAPCVTVNTAVTTAGSAVVVLTCGGCGVMYSVPTPALGADTARMLSVCPHCAHQQPLALTAAAAAPTPKRTKVAIIGFADSWPMAPCHHPEWEVWCLNQFYDLVGGLVKGRINFTDLAKEKRLRWFEIHDRHDLECDPNVIARHPHHVQRMREIGAMGAPVYMQQVWPDIPNSVAYPLQAMTDRFGGYWTNSISYMIALAIAEGFREIGLYGVNMAMDCLAPDMRVLTADLRWVRAGDLVVGQELLAFDEEVPAHYENGLPSEYRKYRKTTIESLSTAKRPCYRLHMADGSTLICSEGHQWLTLGGIKHARRWLRTDELHAQETYPIRCSKIVKATNVWDEDRSWDAGYLAAAFDGEGHLTHIKHRNCSTARLAVGFAQKPNAMSQQVMESMAHLGFEFGPASGGDDCEKYVLRGTRADTLRFLGRVRPRRLMDNFNPEIECGFISIDNTTVLRSEAIGEQETVGIRTGTQTLIVEGFASHNSEYGFQRPSCEYFIGFARGAGIKVHVPTQSDLLGCPYLYGYEDGKANKFMAKLDQTLQEHQQRMVNHAKVRDENEANYQQFHGAIQQLQVMKRNLNIGR